MAIISQTATTAWVDVQGRRVKVFDEQKTQSVNICTPTNTEGEYEQVFYFRGDYRVTAQQVDQYGNLPALVTWLRRQSYDQLQ